MEKKFFKGKNTGDDLPWFKAGCKLIDMEMVQFHPTAISPAELEGSLVQRLLG